MRARFLMAFVAVVAVSGCKSNFVDRLTGSERPSGSAAGAPHLPPGEPDMKTQDNCTGSAVARLYRTLGPADINYSGVARYESSIDGGTACAGQVRVVDGQFEISNLAVVGDDIDYIRPPAGRLKIVMEDDAEIELDYDPMKRDHDFGGVNFCPLCV